MKFPSSPRLPCCRLTEPHPNCLINRPFSRYNRGLSGGFPSDKYAPSHI